jgi:hypothetical protein
MDEIITNIREYAEEMPVKILTDEDNGRLVIQALNECGHNLTLVDLIDVIEWVKVNMPELLK